MAVREEIIIKGKVVTYVEHKHVKNGIALAKWGIERADKKLEAWSCVAWRELADRAKKDIAAGETYFFTGFNDDKNPTAFVVTSYRNEKEKAASVDTRSEIVKTYGSKAAYDELTKAEICWYETREFAKIKIPGRTGYGSTRWQHKRDCIFADGHWQSKMEWLMDKLTPKVVTDLLKELDPLGAKGFNRADYDKKMEQLMQLAGISTKMASPEAESDCKERA